MGSFLLLAGKFIQPDKTQPKVERTTATGQIVYKYPNKEYYVPLGGQPVVVDSDQDLVKKHGESKFAYTGGQQQDDRATLQKLHAELARYKAQFGDLPPGRTSAPGHTPGDVSEENLLHSTAKAPAGQVSTGFQQTGGKEGEPPLGATAPVKPMDLSKQENAPPQQEPPSEDEDDQPSPQASRQSQAPPKTKQEMLARLDERTVEELHEYARHERIDLKGARTKPDIVRAIRQANK